MNMKYENLLSPLEFEDDVTVEVAAISSELLPGPISEDNWVHLSERLWNRVLFLGQAYELHFSQVIEPVIDTVLGPEQCESLLEELEFLQHVSTDPALDKTITSLANECGKVINRVGMRLVLSPP
ncbi:hypothetical protein [Teredinibacter purpureus]|uniref:hypothetical protein n=1 Tax=Teredinibacter purpureus TaxID=2731756 RepID=UPI0013C4BA63|nr:hypothetical protein [Teredinibacter purpureus]